MSPSIPLLDSRTVEPALDDDPAPDPAPDPDPDPDPPRTEGFVPDPPRPDDEPAEDEPFPPRFPGAAANQRDPADGHDAGSSAPRARAGSTAAQDGPR